MAVKKTRRNTRMSDGIAEAMKEAASKDQDSLAAHSDAAVFRKSIFSTGLFEIDVNLRPVFGSRIQLLGEAHKGKSLLSYQMMGAAQNTCRQCLTPIIDFVHDWTGEIVTTCMCGANEKMRVLLVDSENSFDPAWANRWGMDIDPTFQDQADNQIEENVYRSEEDGFFVIKAANAEQTNVITTHLIRKGYVDMVTVDSIANLIPSSRREGKQMIGDHAKAVTQFVTSVVAAQGEAANMDGIAPTLLMINQYRTKIGGFSPTGNPVMAAGGKALEYNNSITWHLNTKYEYDKINNKMLYGDCSLRAKKDKESGATHSLAQYRVYVNPVSKSGIDYEPGDTDEGAKILGFLKELGSLDSRWFEKKGAKYVIFGREFANLGDIKNFLSRRDVGHMLRFPIYAQMFPPTLRMHLGHERYDYTPFKDDPILEMYEEAKKQVGVNVRPRKRVPQPVMLTAKTKRKVRSKSEPDKDSEELFGDKPTEQEAGGES